MTVTLDLPLQVQQAYLAAAQSRGLPPEALMQEVLVAGQPAAIPETQELSPEEWIREYRAWGQRHAHENLPILSDEAISRESIYEDRGL